MNKFTQGKWVACVDGSVDIVDGKGRVIRMFCDIMGAHDEAEMMDNARLIAAAPEMYKLLKFLEYIRHEGDAIWFKESAQELLARIDGEEANNE